MNDEEDAAREYDRLRAELADFVLAALSERIAAGQEPKLGQALTDAIDRRVEEAVAARLASADWPDPDSFADQVIAAAAGRSGGERAARRADSRGARRPAEPRRGLTSLQIILLALVGVIVVASATYFLLKGWSAPTTNTVIMNAQTREPEPEPANIQQPLVNGPAPDPGQAPQNVAEPAP